ncbi:MAG TPA: hypothetical protein VEC37_17560, partial [Bacillota bacterium]|nr:hypothetical protein [Bacillota bacterium]
MTELNQAKVENEGFTAEIAADMQQKGIDLHLTRKILDKINQGAYDHIEPVRVTGIPEVDGKTIINLTGTLNQNLDFATAQSNIDRLGLRLQISEIGTRSGSSITFSKEQLSQLGTLLYPVVSYGVLNGGS